MINVKLTVQDEITPMLRRQRQELAKFPRQALDEFVDLTPVRSGNARNRTKLANNNNTIVADYPYAQRLDDGWSKQAPRGMTQPFEAWVRRWVTRVFGR
jgi:hypothetical protein